MISEYYWKYHLCETLMDQVQFLVEHQIVLELDERKYHSGLKFEIWW